MSFTPRRSAKISVRLAVAAFVLGGGVLVWSQTPPPWQDSFYIGSHLSNSDFEAMHSFMTSFPEAERKGIFVLALEDDRLISNVEGEAANWELTLGQHAPQTPQIPIPIGTSGSTGTGGTSGTSGTTGTTGTSGTSGTSGTTGTTGTSGTSGTTGATGTSGTTGSTGTSGTSGSTGSTGSTGTVGDDPGQCQDWNETRPPNVSAQSCSCSGDTPALYLDGLAGHDPASGSFTGVFRRVLSTEGFLSIKGVAFLPSLSDIQLGSPVGNLALKDAAYIYLKSDYVTPANVTIKSEGGFKFDGIVQQKWKPYLAISDGRPEDPYYSMQPSVQSGLRFLEPGRAWSCTLGIRPGPGYAWMRIGKAELNTSLGYKLRGTAQTRLNGQGRVERVIAIAQRDARGAATRDVNRDSKLCGARWAGIYLRSSDNAPYVVPQLASVAHAVHWPLEGTPYVKQQRLSPTSQTNYGSWDLDYVNITLGRFQ